MAKKNLPQRPQQHVTDTRAQKFVEDILPDEWIFQKSTTDYGVDYQVEIVQDGSVTGAHFLIQLKGTEHLVVRKGKYISHSCETSTLNYFLQRPELVIYVVYDVANKTGYWIWVQDFLNEESNTNWQNLQSKTIKIPLSNVFNKDALKEIERRVMAKHFEDTLLRAIQTAQNPDFNYSYKKLENRLEVAAHPKNVNNSKVFDITSSFVFDQTSEAQKALRDLETSIKTGAPVKIKAEYIKDLNLPKIFSDLNIDFDKSGLRSIEILPQDNTVALPKRVTFYDDSRNILFQIPYIQFWQIQGGTEEFTMSSKNSQPSYTITIIANHTLGTGSLQLSPNQSKLNAVQLRELARLDKAFCRCSFIEVEDLQRNIKEFKFDNQNKITTPNFDQSITEFIENMAFIQEKLNKTIIMTGQTTELEKVVAARVTEVLKTGILKAPIISSTLDVSVNKLTANELLVSGIKEDDLMYFSMPISKSSLTLQGTEIELGSINFVWQNLRVTKEIIEQLNIIGNSDDAIAVLAFDTSIAECFFHFNDWVQG